MYSGKTCSMVYQVQQRLTVSHVAASLVIMSLRRRWCAKPQTLTQVSIRYLQFTIPQTVLFNSPLQRRIRHFMTHISIKEDGTRAVLVLPWLQQYVAHKRLILSSQRQRIWGKNPYMHREFRLSSMLPLWETQQHSPSVPPTPFTRHAL